MDNLKAVSLFTGAGGLDLGLERAFGGRLTFQAWVENDESTRETLLANDRISNPDAFFRDITDVSSEDIMRSCGLRQGEAFLVAGGPPCQAFSTAGLRQTVNSEEGAVVHNYFAVIRELRPRFFVFENVRGLLSAALKHRPLKERRDPKEVPEDERERLGSVMDMLIMPTFKKLRYEVVVGILNSADYGSAQIRHRVIILGSREKEFGSVPFRKMTSRSMAALDLVPVTYHPFARYGHLQPYRTLKEAIGHLASSPPEPGDTYTYSDERASVFAQIPPGENWTYIRDNEDLFPDGFLVEAMGKRALASTGGKTGYYRRLSWDDPAPTLTAQPQQLASSLCHPDFERPLSIPEYAALQDFPPDYEFKGSKSRRYRQIGNAVPVRLAEAIGGALLGVAGLAGQ